MVSYKNIGTLTAASVGKVRVVWTAVRDDYSTNVTLDERTALAQIEPTSTRSVVTAYHFKVTTLMPNRYCIADVALLEYNVPYAVISTLAARLSVTNPNYALTTGTFSLSYTPTGNTNNFDNE